MKTSEGEVVCCIKNGIERWLGDEIENSDRGRNAYLSDYHRLRNELFLPFDDPENTHANKVSAHHDRLELLAPRITKTNLENDGFLGKLLFMNMMMLAGVNRMYSYFRSDSVVEYSSRRLQRAVFIDDPTDVIANEIELYGRTSPTSETVNGFRARVISTNSSCIVLNRSLYEWSGKQAPTFRGRIAPIESEPVEALRNIERQWLGLASAQICLAACLRGGDIGSVPVFEPKSISDVNRLVFPFSS